MVRWRNGDFVDPELGVSFVRMHIVHTGRECNDRIVFNRDDEMMTRVMQEFLRLLLVDRIVEDTRGDATQQRSVTR